MRSLSFLILSIFLFSSFTIGDNCNNIPDLNKQIVAIIKTKVNQKVGRGECWDLAAEVLNSTGAKWDHEFGFGNEVNPATDCIFPGDIIQFKNVEVEYQVGNTIYNENMDHHTAIIYEVKEKGNYMMAEQNTAAHGRKVSIDPLDLKNVKKGKIRFYRPVK